VKVERPKVLRQMCALMQKPKHRSES
jgi:hypothetical protein